MTAGLNHDTGVPKIQNCVPKTSLQSSHLCVPLVRRHWSKSTWEKPVAFIELKHREHEHIVGIRAVFQMRWRPLLLHWKSTSLCLLFLYVCGSIYIFSAPLRAIDSHTYTINSTNTINHHHPQQRHQQLRHRAVPVPLGTKTVDALVLIALGPAARSTSLLYALRSLKEDGGWRGPIYVIVDAQNDLDCLMSHLPNTDHISVLQTQPMVKPVGSNGNAAAAAAAGISSGKGGYTIAQAKMAKMHLLDHLPKTLQRIVYIDVDIITQRPLAPFIEMVDRLWAEVGSSVVEESSGENKKTERETYTNGLVRGGEPAAVVRGGITMDNTPQTSTVLIFPDAGGHTIPVCPGCDLAHSGVVGIERGRSELCLQLWLEAFQGDEGAGRQGTATDQEALDYAIRKGARTREGNNCVPYSASGILVKYTHIVVGVLV